jgi:hypothetical protein
MVIMTKPHASYDASGIELRVYAQKKSLTEKSEV